MALDSLVGMNLDMVLVSQLEWKDEIRSGFRMNWNGSVA